MVTKKESMRYNVRENMRGGGGSVHIYDALPQENLPPHCRLLSPIVLNRGCGIGNHVHEGETEVFYCVSGEGVYDDNGTEHVMQAGDISSTGNGEYHSIRNEKDEPLVLLAVITTEK